MGELSHNAVLLLIALALDALVGDPDWLWRRFRHPVVVLGALIAWLDEALNLRDWPGYQRRISGVAALLILLAVSGGIAFILSHLLRGLSGGGIVEAALAAILLAQKSLFQHVKAVAFGLEEGGLAGGRAAVSQIVGRDPNQLDEAGVSRAALESLSENLSDGVVAPAFWFLIGGLPGIVLYKAINTADSMIGHKSERYREFGWAAARLDDLVNLPASRLTALLLLITAWGLSGGSVAKRGLCMVWRDAGKHRSPNAGWPEAALAGALDVSLSGPRVYAGEGKSEEPWVNEKGWRTPGATDIRRGLRLCFYALWMQALLVLVLAIA